MESAIAIEARVVIFSHWCLSAYLKLANGVAQVS
jgi:hypothetical protein